MPLSICLCIVTAAPGAADRQVGELLLGPGASSLIAQSRRADKVVALHAQRPEIRDADFADAASLDEALAGVDRLLIVPTHRADVAANHQQHLRAVLAAAVRVGVRHIVYPIAAVATAHLERQQVASRRQIEQSGLPYTVLRVGCLSDYLLHRIPIALRSGEWPTSAPEGVGTFISREEATRAVAAALHSKTPSVGLVGVQGSQALSAQALVDTVNQVFGAHIELEPVDDDALLDGFTAAGVDALTATELVAVDRAMRMGSLDVASGRSTSLEVGPVVSVRDFLAHRRLDILLASKHGWPVVGAFSTAAASLQFP